MARIRSIKPDFWTDEKIVELDFEDRLLFIGLWNFADDQGYLDYSPRRIKMQVFPGDSIDVSRGLARLHEASLIALYDSPEGRVIHITNWTRHQRVSNPARPRFEPESLTLCAPASVALVSPLEPSRVIGKGREGKGEKTSPPADAGDDFNAFWALYPRKVKRIEAIKAWTKAVRSEDAQTIIAGLRRYLPVWASKDPEFIPHASSWLRAERWNDEIRPVVRDDDEPAYRRNNVTGMGRPR